MCGRFVTASSPALIADRFAVDDVDATVAPDPEPDYNVSPRRNVLVVREQAREEGKPQRVLSRLRWGLVPSWAKELKVGDRMINARAETVASKPAYRRAFANKRCLIPADGFYEWKAGAGSGAGSGAGGASGKARPKKQPYFIHRKDGEPLAFAGLWEVWKVPDDSPDDVKGVGSIPCCSHHCATILHRCRLQKSVGARWHQKDRSVEEGRSRSHTTKGTSHARKRSRGRHAGAVEG